MITRTGKVLEDTFPYPHKDDTYELHNSLMPLTVKILRPRGRTYIKVTVLSILDFPG